MLSRAECISAIRSLNARFPGAVWPAVEESIRKAAGVGGAVDTDTAKVGEGSGAGTPINENDALIGKVRTKPSLARLHRLLGWTLAAEDNNTSGRGKEAGLLNEQ